MKQIMLTALSCVLAGYISGANATTILYNDFSNLSGLTLNGTAQSLNPNSDAHLRLTNSTGQASSAFSTNAIQLDNNASFSTAFSFNISNPINGGADGLTFTLQTVSNSAGGGGGGGGIGYAGIGNSMAVEFDTWYNGEVGDISGSHVGINLYGNPTSVAQVNVANPYLDQHTSNTWFSWVDYNGVADLLEVRLSNVDLRPETALLAYTVDLSTVLGSTLGYAGFTSGTGWAGAQHDILNWQFESSFKPIENVGASVPEPAMLPILLIGLSGLVLARRKRQ